MVIKIEAEATVVDQELVDSLSKESDLLLRMSLEGAEFPVEIEGVRFMINVVNAELYE